MNPRKICVLITARPSYARIKTALAAIQSHDDLELQLVVTGSALLARFGDVASVIRADGFTVTEQVYIVVEGENLVTSTKSTGIALMELATVLDRLAPDIVLTVADRYETLATAIAASYMNIPVSHVQGGETTGSIDDKVRNSVTMLSDLHFPSTQLAAERIIRMGKSADLVHRTGCPSIDLAAITRGSDRLEFDPFTEYGGVGEKPDLSKGYLVVMQHPVTTEYAFAGDQMVETIEAVEQSQIPALWFWPNVDAGSDAVSKVIRVYREQGRLANAHFFRNMSPEHFLGLLNHCTCIIGNSSVAIREGSFLGVPAVNVGTRQRGRERGRERGRNVLDVGNRRREIAEAIALQAANERYESDQLYGDGEAGQRIADLLATVALEIGG